jgi:hypothetical protein
MLFTNEIFPSKTAPLFLIEGKQWKWEYRFNLVGILEFSRATKTVGENTLFTTKTVGRLNSKTGQFFLVKILGNDIFENSLRVKSELLKAKRSSVGTLDLVSSLSLEGINFFRNEVTASFTEFFLQFRAGETTRRMITATKSVFIPDLPIVKAHITGCDVIHS